MSAYTDSILFYEMGNGRLIEVAGRPTKPKDIRKMQDEEWARRQGGICGVRLISEPHAVYFARREFNH